MDERGSHNGVSVTQYLHSAQLGSTTVIGIRGDVLSVSSTRPQPPGTRIALAEPGRGGIEIQGKVTNVIATNGRWEIKIKLFAPSKKAKRRLEELAGEHIDRR